jgi:hypothetical protein
MIPAQVDTLLKALRNGRTLEDYNGYEHITTLSRWDPTAGVFVLEHEGVDHDEFFDELGWGRRLKEDPGLKNTCAIRMSYCLVQSGLNLRGGYKILKGPHKNELKKKGLMSFMEIDGYQDMSGNPSGHIDLIWTEKDTTSIFGLELWSTTSEECGTHCYWEQSKELLFWELK